MSIVDETLAGVIEDAIQAQSDASYKAGVDVALDFIEAVLIVRLADAVVEQLIIDQIVSILADIRKELQS